MEKANLEASGEQRPKETVTPAKTKSHRGLIIALIICLVVVLAAAGFFVYKLIDNQNVINELEAQVAALQAEPVDQEDADEPEEVPLIDQLFAAFEAAGYNQDGTTLIDATNSSGIKNSPLAPYQTINVLIGSSDGIGGGYGFFFREGENGAWQFAFAGNGVPSCQQFSFWKFRLIFPDIECVGDDTGADVTTVGKYFEF